MLGKKTLHKLILIVGIALIFLTALSTMHFTTLAAPGLTCELRNVEVGNDCPSGETCVFSLNQKTNSHAGNCSYGSLKVCCEDSGETLDSVVKTDDCDPTLNEGGVLSLYKTSNSHAKQYSSTDSLNYVCLNSTFAPIQCVYKNSCDTAGGEVCLASLNQTSNSHVANCSEYPIKICCGYGIIPGVCGDGVLNSGEECDPGPPIEWGYCEPYEKCNITTCQCYDFRPECTGCKYYDYCREGMNSDDLSEPCCEDPNTGLPTECCVDKNFPLIPKLNCSDNGIRNLNVNASYDLCHNEECDMTGKCIDASYVAHEMFQRC